MATLFPEIKTKNWQLSTVGVGYIAEGLADIRQCLDILLRTQKGTDPLRPQFGCDISKYVDRPVTYAIPNIIRAIIEAISIWEKRVVLKSIRYQIETSDQLGQVRFFVTVQLADDELIDLILLYLNGGFIIPDQVDTGSLTLFALYPPNPNGKRYTISFIGNEETITPLPPLNGFANILELYNWVKNNWGGYGSWQMGNDRITLFVPNGLLTTGSLTMSLLGLLTFKAPIPLLSVGEDYAISFSPDSQSPSPAAPSSFSSIGAMLTWLNANWSAYGTWSVESNPYGNGDFDIQDFNSEDFDVGSPAIYLLVLSTETINTCSLEVSIA